MFGKLFKVRSSKNDLPIAINYLGKTIPTVNILKLNRPYVVFYSNDYVYYLSVKSITKKNKYKTTSDDRNVIVPNRNIYGKEVEIGNAINCSVINVMERNLFESLFEVDNKWNDVELDAKIYKDVMSKLRYTFSSKKTKFYQVVGFDTYKTKFIKEKKIDSQIKTAAISFIDTYFELFYTPLTKIDETLSKLPNEYSSLKKHFMHLFKITEEELNNDIQKQNEQENNVKEYNEMLNMFSNNELKKEDSKQRTKKKTKKSGLEL
ncbi:hypothetical protein BCF89_1361 [Metamycoplasma auris]|uniref:Uncharacterized protein n=2 Tax=Metamycoplasma auris TaxID=51363 RepID=A0A2W7FXA3_9BACT|nr:hypothetical protein BCF89_1361 [Metamycoplasma auris]